MLLREEILFRKEEPVYLLRAARLSSSRQQIVASYELPIPPWGRVTGLGLALIVDGWVVYNYIYLAWNYCKIASYKAS